MHRFSYQTPPQNASDIAQRLGLRRAGRGWRGRCPACGYAGSLALDERGARALLWCASCADRAAMGRLLRGGEPPRAAEVEPPARRTEAERAERARALWAGGEALTPGCPGGRYLEHRRIGHVIGSPALRWRRDCPSPAGGRRIALLAAITGPDGEFQAIQRIFLTRDGEKADIEPRKATLGPMAGGAIRLQTCSGELAIAEGLESAASAGLLLDMPAWAAISAGNLARSMTLPEEIRSVTIAADHDEPGLRAAEEATWRWQGEGRVVRIIRACAPGRDANDVARAAGASS